VDVLQPSIEHRKGLDIKYLVLCESLSDIQNCVKIASGRSVKFCNWLLFATIDFKDYRRLENFKQLVAYSLHPFLLLTRG
jgi:hypothetical protein